MRQVALRGLRARALRTMLTAVSVVLGVAMISGTYVLTDTINKSFSEVFTQANSGTDVVVAPKKVDDAFYAEPPPLKDEPRQRDPSVSTASRPSAAASRATSRSATRRATGRRQHERRHGAAARAA